MRGKLNNMDQREIDEFVALAKPIMQWLCGHCHPHTHVIITSTDAEISEGVAAFYSEDYLSDKP
jgi:hypothetical protein